jgi:hypothetical protein
MLFSLAYFLVRRRRTSAAGRRAPSRAGTLDGHGDDQLDRCKASSLGAEPLLQALQVELEVVADEFRVRGHQNDAELVRSHLLIPKNHLRPGEKPPT